MIESLIFNFLSVSLVFHSNKDHCIFEITNSSKAVNIKKYLRNNFFYKKIYIFKIIANIRNKAIVAKICILPSYRFNNLLKGKPKNSEA